MNIISNLTYNFLLIYIIYKGIKLIFDETTIYNKFIEICSYILYYIFIILLPINKNIIPILLINIICIFLIQFNYKTNIKDKILITLYICLILFISQLFNIIILMILNKINVFSKFFSINVLTFIVLLIQLIIFWAILKSIKNLKNMVFEINMPKYFWLPLIMVPIFSIILLSIIVTNNKIYYVDLAIITFSLLLFNVCIFMLYNSIIELLVKVEKQNILETKHINYIKQFTVLKENYENLNIIKHDIRKHYLYIYKLLENGHYEECLQYIDELNNNKNILNQTDKIVNTDNICVDILLNVKINEAKNNNIDIKTDIKIPYDLDVYSYDMVCLLGNLLDNAIEANIKLKEEERYIFLKIKYYNQKLFINIKNRYNDILKDKNGYIISTKNNRQEKYGFGMKIIRRLIRKYNGAVDIQYNKDIFELNIILQL